MNPQTPARLTGSASMSFQNPVYVVSCASVVGKKEGEGSWMIQLLLFMLTVWL